MAQILPPRFSAEDNTGAPLSGGKLYTYIAGTSTNKTTYSDPGLTSANDNPVVLDSRGEAAIFGSGTYKLVLKTSADVTIYTQDDAEVASSTLIFDADGDTKVQCEESPDEDIIRFDIAGTEKMQLNSTSLDVDTINEITSAAGVTIEGILIKDTAIADLTVTNLTLTNLTLTNLLGHALPGFVRRPKFSWKDGDEIYIDPGMYHHQGTTEQMVYWDSQITFVLQSTGSNAASDDYGADGWHYIYLDDSAIVTQGVPLLDADCFQNLTGANTVPVWTVAKHGWYGDGVGSAGLNDRCIFAVYETGGVILEFFHENNFVLFADSIATRAAATLTTSFADITALRIPSFCKEARIVIGSLYVSTGGGNNGVAWRTNGQSGATGHSVGPVNADSHTNTVSVRVITDSSGVLEMKEGASTDYTYSVSTTGWYFPIGM